MSLDFADIKEGIEKAYLETQGELTMIQFLKLIWFQTNVNL